MILNINNMKVLNARILNKRVMGKSVFLDTLCNGADLQMYLNTTNVGVDTFNEILTKPNGTFIKVEGEHFITKTGHPSFKVFSCEILHIPIKALPVVQDDGVKVYNEITNMEIVRRQRYLKTITEQKERDIFITRSRLINLVRQFFISRNYLEVETPTLQPIYGGAEATPFVTKFEALDMDFYMRIAPELYLRRMIIGGYDRVFEIGKNFRNEGLSNKHNPEFTFMEAYTAFYDYNYSMHLVTELITEIAATFGNSIEYKEQEINLSNIHRITYRDCVAKYCNVDVNELSDERLVELFENDVEQHLIDPTIVYDYPASVSPLALPSKSNPNIAERFELYVGGMEIGNAYSELNDVQKHIENLGDADKDFIEALSYGMPPTTGIGLGLDRLVMLLTNKSIRDVIYFPAMKNKVEYEKL